MILPTEEQCLAYFDKFKVPNNIKNHCLKVREVALFLAKELNKNNVSVNIDLVDKSALLHDLFKMATLDSLEPTEHHDNCFNDEEVKMWKHLRIKYPNMFENEIAHHLFKDDFPELAKTIKDACDPIKEDKTIEEEIVHYADYVVMGQKVILLNDRLEYLKNRYQCEESYRKKYEELAFQIEKEIFNKLGFDPRELSEKIKENEITH